MKATILVIFSVLFCAISYSQRSERLNIKKVRSIIEGWKKKANKGDLIYMIRLAKFYSDGYYEENKKDESFCNGNSQEKWANMAAATGQAEGYTILGDFFKHANIYDYRNDSAILYYRKGVILGSNIAANNLANMYEKGYDLGRYNNLVPPNLDSAFKYYQLAAAMNNPEANYKIGRMYLLSTDMQKHDAAIKYFKMAADNSFQPAIDVLDDYNTAKDIPYERAIAATQVGKDTAAFKLVKIAAEINNSVPAMCMLGHSYLRGKGVGTNYELAVYWLQRAADAGLGEADYWLGSYYYEQRRDFSKAITYYLKAEKEGYQAATYMLPLVRNDLKDNIHDANREAAKIAQRQEEAKHSAPNDPKSDQYHSTKVKTVHWCWDCEGTGKIYNVYGGKKLSSWHACGACNGKGYTE
ncbi:MAG: tetratricopeptide repeat protein [Ferruginibacter sp.]